MRSFRPVSLRLTLIMSGSGPLPCEPSWWLSSLPPSYPSLFLHDKRADLNTSGVLKNCEVHVHPNLPKKEVTLHV